MAAAYAGRTKGYVARTWSALRSGQRCSTPRLPVKYAQHTHRVDSVDFDLDFDQDLTYGYFDLYSEIVSLNL